ncbi:LppP/LprE lipoprotein [Williamsia limnetica]|uniref:LppP/LprE lipoprotein n=1 Tax=Williamsia limnetica TaxID=882452 RepID=A0A318RKE8_WILLI|nr:LppP/LprE lipoprotein [Williamsia limnetica]
MKTTANARFSTRICVITIAASIAAAVATGCGTADEGNASPAITTLTETEVSATTITSPPAQDSPATSPLSQATCDVDTAMIDSAIAQIAPPMPGSGWVEGESNVNTCASLTYVTLDTQGGTVSSPYQLLLFHDGEFLGTGTACNLSYQTVAATADDRIDVRYRYITGDEPNADPQGEVYVSYYWNGSGVDMLGELPEAITRGEC